MITITPVQINNQSRFNAKNLSFYGYEKTFMMLKPDAFERHLDGQILDMFDKNKGLKITKQWEGVAPRQKLENNWAEKRNKPFFRSWMDFMSSGKVKAMVVEGDDAIPRVLEFKKAVRNIFARGEKRRNLLHCSDDKVSAQREIANFFDAEV